MPHPRQLAHIVSLKMIHTTAPSYVRQNTVIHLRFRPCKRLHDARWLSEGHNIPSVILAKTTSWILAPQTRVQTPNSNNQEIPLLPKRKRQIISNFCASIRTTKGQTHPGTLHLTARAYASTVYDHAKNWSISVTSSSVLNASLQVGQMHAQVAR